MKRTIRARNIEVSRTWVDASYVTHDDRKSHTGGCYSLGTGLTHHKTSKQKINTRSSTEAELVGASDYVAYTVWITGFLKYQGYKVRNNIFYQDNQSAIKFEKNGKTQLVLDRSTLI